MNRKVEFDNFLKESDIGVPGTDIGCKYHYTDIRAVRGIIENNNIWVSNAMFLNDKSEVKYAKNVIEDTIRSNQEISNQVIEIIEDFIAYIVDNSDQIFVLSTSDNIDSQLLWSNYSNMDGYCLGFDFSNSWDYLFIRSHQGEKLVLEPQKHIRIDRVLYDRKKQRDFIKEPLKKVDQYYRKNPDGDLTGYMHYFFHVLMMFKDPKFRHEEEFRIVFVIPEYEDFVEYYVSNGILIPYVEVNFTEKIPLDHIKIGPRNDIDIAQASIESFLKTKGFPDVEVSKSRIPLRF
ncbi:MAG: DUF2971 domain-containing protein [Halanaerobiaceae bacterium]